MDTNEHEYQTACYLCLFVFIRGSSHGDFHEAG